MFSDVLVGTYSLSIEMRGFKSYRLREINLTAGQIRGLGDILLSVGEVTETVTVEATAATLDLASGEKSGVITASDLENTALRGRDYLDMLRLMPGVVDESEGREAPGRTASATCSSTGRAKTRKTSRLTA